MTTREALKDFLVIANNVGDNQNVPPVLILSIIYQESRGAVWATRYEPDYNYLYMPMVYKDKLGISLATETNHQKTSWGLMQIMLATAREEGFDDYAPALCVPATNIHFGAKVLSRLLNKYAGINPAIAAYNAGTPQMRQDGSGLYKNQLYVDSVQKWMIEISQWA